MGEVANEQATGIIGFLQRLYVPIYLWAVDTFATKSTAVVGVSYDSNGKKIKKTINGTDSDVVSAATIVSDGGGLTEVNTTNHYSPQADNNSELTASLDGTEGSYALGTEYSVVTGVKAQRDAKGHVVGLKVSKQKVKDTNTTYTIASKATCEDIVSELN